MPTQRLAPDAALVLSNLTGTIANVQDDPDAPDGSWLAATDAALNTEARVSFPTPAGNPTGTQEIRVLVRKSATGGSTPSVLVELWEAGTLRATVVPTTSVTSTTGVVVAGAFDAATLTDPSGGSVEVRVFGQAPGGKPADRRSIGIGALEWNAVTADPPLPSVATTGIAPATGSASATTTTAHATGGSASATALVAGASTSTRITTGAGTATASVTAVTVGAVQVEVHETTGTAQATASGTDTTATARTSAGTATATAGATSATATVRTITATARALAGVDATHATSRVASGVATSTSSATATTSGGTGTLEQHATTGTAASVAITSHTMTTTRTSEGDATAVADATSVCHMADAFDHTGCKFGPPRPRPVAVGQASGHPFRAGSPRRL